jgi:hypothetical protein
MQSQRTTSEQGTGNKELMGMLHHALKETETPQLELERNILRNDNAFERPRLPASVLFHYRNHTHLLRMRRNG